MRALALVHHYGPARAAGAETHLHAMLAALTARGHQVDVVLSRQTGAPYQLDGVRVWPTIDVAQDHWPYLRDADLIISHLENTPRAAALGRLNGIPVAIVAHNTLPRTLEALRSSWARVDLLAVNSLHMAAHYAGAVAPQVVVRPIPDPAQFATTPGDRVTLINLRRRAITPESTDGLTKGGELFRALAQRLPAAKFLGVTGAYGVQENLADLPNVDVIDHVDHVRMRDDVYGRTRVLLVPSSYESWGRVAGEAICSGIPVIAAPTPGLREQLGRAGIYLDPQDVDAWVDTLCPLLALPWFWDSQSQLARARAEKLAAARPGDLAAWCDAAETIAA